MRQKYSLASTISLVVSEYFSDVWLESYVGIRVCISYYSTVDEREKICIFSF